MKRTKQDQEITKNLIIEVAWSLFEQQGYYHTSLDYIAKMVWVTRGSIYSNFSWKIDLLEHILGHNNRKFEISLEIDSIKAECATEKLENIIKIYFSLLINDKNFRHIERLHNFEKFIWEEAELLENFSNNDIESLHIYVEEIYKQGVLDWEFKNSFTPSVFANSFIVLFIWIIFSYLWSDSFESNKKISLKSLSVLLTGIK
jgi:AcrR family transcriptional regulator